MTSRKSNLSLIIHTYMIKGFVCDGLYLMVTVNIQSFVFCIKHIFTFQIIKNTELIENDKRVVKMT